MQKQKIYANHQNKNKGDILPIQKLTKTIKVLNTNLTVQVRIYN